MFNLDRCIDYFKRLLDVDSTTGQYEEIQKVLCGILDEMGVTYRTIRKGGVYARPVQRFTRRLLKQI